MRLVIAALALALSSTAHAQQPPPSALEICLGAVTSRYIGETEKNLGRVFRVARQSDHVLTFDEADALFGRRSEVRDSHDRYANQEVSYLMQRIERFRDVQILASNNRRTLVAGFNRRSRNAGIVIVQTDAGVRAIEFSSAGRARALDYVRDTLDACPPE
jgi:SpoVK/Ycf46/Vps4 family AAA+-type ATPase